MPVYSTTSLSNAAAQLTLRLGDATPTYRPLDELYALIIESLRIFQSLTGYYRERATFTTTSGVPFYDLRTALSSQYAFTVTDDQLVAAIQRHLIELVANPWTGTAQFSITDIAQALQAVRDDFQLSTGIYAVRPSLLGVNPNTDRMQLDQSVIDIRRLAWKDTASGVTLPMFRTDEFAANAYFTGWPIKRGRPYAYSIAVAPPITVVLIPPNLLAGSLDLCVIESGPALAANPSSPALIGIPDDFAYGITWGALSRLLSHDGPAQDSPRAMIAEELHRLAWMAAVTPLSALVAEVNQVPVAVESIQDLDHYRTGWMQQSGKPDTLAFVSANLVALAPVPDGGYSISLELSRSFPIPDVNNPGTTYLQVGSELIDPILDMAQYLASFKEGTSDIQVALPCRQRFLERCGYMNQRLRANATYNLLLNQPAARQQLTLPRVMPEQAPTPAPPQEEFSNA